jgi:hypothetical protein
MVKEVSFITSTSVHGKIVKGSLGGGNTIFHLNKLFEKSLSLGYWNSFDREKLGDLIGELQEVYDNMEDKKEEVEKT